MWDNIIGRHIRRCNRNLLLVNAAILSALFIWAFSAERYLYNCFAGPFPSDHSDLARFTDAGNLRRYYVLVDQLKPVETGLQTIEQQQHKYTHEVNSQKVTAHYFATAINDRILLIKSPESKPVTSYQAALVVVPHDVRAWFQKQLLDEKGQKFSDVFLPYLLDATSFRSDAYMALAIAIPIGLLAAYNVSKALKRMNNIEASPIYKWLQHFYHAPAALADLIDQDYKRNDDTSSISSLCLTSSWLLHKRFFQLDVVHLNEIVWIYEKVTRHYYSFIPTAKTYALVFVDKWGRQIEVDAGRGQSKEKVMSFLQIIANRIPWVVVGYSHALKREYEKNRDAFVADVDERRVVSLSKQPRDPS